MLLICYVFGLRGLFNRVSKSAILNIKDENDICELWPLEVRNKIKAIRRAKIEQIQNCCSMAISEYLGKPTPASIRYSTANSLQFTSAPKCPKGDFACDALNMGWLIIFFNELGIIPSIMKLGEPKEPPKGSLQDIVAQLKSVRSPPLKEGHGSACDFAPSFRNAINDVYNSITGLTLKDITGQEGWSLSRCTNIPQAEEFFSQPSNDGFSTPSGGSEGNISTLRQSLRRERNRTSSTTSQLDTPGSNSQSHTPISEEIENAQTSPTIPLSPTPQRQTQYLSKDEVDHILWSGMTSKPSTPPPSDLPLNSPPTSRFSRSISSSSDSNAQEEGESGNQKYLFESKKEIIHGENKFLRDETDRRIGIGLLDS